VRAKLPWNDKADFENAKRGFIAKLPDPVNIPTNFNPNVSAWTLAPYTFLNANNTLDDAPDTVHPALWRMGKLNMQHG